MRHVPHPVAVITSTHKGTSSGWRGATVSSFNTVTLEPRPVVSFNIKKLSSTYEAIKHSRAFNVHLFTPNETSRMIARRFSSGNASSPFRNTDGSPASFSSTMQAVDLEAPLAGGAPGGPSWQSPVIDPTPEPLFLLKCIFLSSKTVEIADHMVIFGEVFECQHELSKVDKSSTFLYYVNGEYSTDIAT
jgi:flavin reductase (DIM6/NTAB) family NADH-FMN oxidoreductase RutF